MRDTLSAVAQFSPTQLLTSLAVLTPFVAGIWVAMKWAYDTRLRNLETALSDFRSDFERRLVREAGRLTDAHELALLDVEQQLQSAVDRAAVAERRLLEFEKAAADKETQLASRAHDLEQSEKRMAGLLETLLNDSISPDSKFEVMIFQLGLYSNLSPSILGHLRLSQTQIYDLERLIEKGHSAAMYVYGSLAMAGRISSKSPQEGTDLVRRAAEQGAFAAMRFMREHAA